MLYTHPSILIYRCRDVSNNVIIGTGIPHVKSGLQNWEGGVKSPKCTGLLSFLNFQGGQESIPPAYPGAPGRQPYSFSVPSPIDCSKIPAPSRNKVVLPARQAHWLAESISGLLKSQVKSSHASINRIFVLTRLFRQSKLF